MPQHGRIQRVAPRPQRPRAGRDAFLRNPKAVQNSPEIRPVFVDPQGVLLVLDHRYLPRDEADQGLFLQRADLPLLWMLPAEPTDGATGVNRFAPVIVHMLGNYPTAATVKIKLNGVEQGREIVAGYYGGIQVKRLPVEEVPGGKVLARGEGTETVAGAQSVDWTFTVEPRRQSVTTATSVVPIRAIVQAIASSVVLIRRLTEGLATSVVRVRLAAVVVGEASGRVFVGEFVAVDDGSGSLNIALRELDDDQSGSVEIRGFQVDVDPSGSFEIRGVNLSDEPAGSVNISQKLLNDDGSGSLNIALRDTTSDLGGSVIVWGTADAYSAPKLVFRVSSLPAAVKAALEAAGVKFNPP